MAIHYIFNIEYHPKIRDLLYFVQEKMLGLQDDGRKSSAQYLSFSTAISCMQTLNWTINIHVATLAGLRALMYYVMLWFSFASLYDNTKFEY